MQPKIKKKHVRNSQLIYVGIVQRKADEKEKEVEKDGNENE